MENGGNADGTKNGRVEKTIERGGEEELIGGGEGTGCVTVVITSCIGWSYLFDDCSTVASLSNI